MVLLSQKIFHSPKLSSKLDNHHHHREAKASSASPHSFRSDVSEALSASLDSFRSNVSNSLNQLSPNLKAGPEFLSLTWIQQCLELLPALNKAFAKLVAEIEYPINQWEVHSTEKYLCYSLKLLDLLNSISSSLSHLSQARVSISHALSLVESSPQSAIERLGTVRFKKQSNESKAEEKEESDQEMNYSGKQLVFHEALEEMKRTGYWVCGVVLFGLSGDIEPYTVVKKAARGSPDSSLVALDLSFSEAVAAEEEKVVPKQLREVDEAAACLVAAVGDGSAGGAAEQLGRKLELMEELLDRIGKEADGVFSEVLAGRNEVLDVLRQLKQ